MGRRNAMFDTPVNTQELTNFLGQGFKYKDCSADYKKGVSFTPGYCNIMEPDAFLKAYGDKTVPQKVDNKYVSSNKGMGRSQLNTAAASCRKEEMCYSCLLSLELAPR